MRRAIAVSLLMFFLMAQTVTLWHAEIHPFHEHEESCEVFEQLEKLPVIIDTAPAFIKAPRTVYKQPYFSPRSVVGTFTVAYDARAPPLAPFIFSS